MALAKKDTELAIAQAQGGQVVYISPAITSRRVETKLAQQVERIRATGEIVREAMHEMSDIEREASYLASVTGEVRDHHAKLAEARGVSAAEQAAHQERFENHLRRLGQLAEMGNITLIMEVDSATEALNQRSFADTLEEVGARITDVVAPRLPPGRR